MRGGIPNISHTPEQIYPVYEALSVAVEGKYSLSSGKASRPKHCGLPGECEELIAWTSVTGLE